jgi:hypothetical protein
MAIVKIIIQKFAKIKFWMLRSVYAVFDEVLHLVLHS